VESQAALNAIRQKIRQKLDEGFLLNGHLIRVKISIGIATYPKDGDSPEALIKQADMRMYADKKTAQQNTTRP
jgi:diguanylate cyclase (GGDEF)-like protein